MRVIGLVGWSGSGKTTFVTRIIPLLRKQGKSVATLKHAHHGFDVDQPGKDSYEHRQAGANQVLVSSPKRLAHMVEHPKGTPEPRLSDLLQMLQPVDLVLVEGFKRENHCKITIHRPSLSKKPLWPELSNVMAVLSDDLTLQCEKPLYDLNDLDTACQLVWDTALPLDQTFNMLNV